MIKYIFAVIYNCQKNPTSEGNENITLRVLFFSTVFTILIGIILWGYIFDITPTDRVYNLAILAMGIIGFAVDYWAYLTCVRNNQYKSFVKESRYNTKSAKVIGQIIRKAPVILLIIYAFYFQFFACE